MAPRASLLRSVLPLAGALLLVASASCSSRKKQAVQPNDRATCAVDIEVSGVPCEANCPLVEQALANVDGVTAVKMDFATHTASIDAVHPACGGEGFDEMVGALEDAGFSGTITATR